MRRCICIARKKIARAFWARFELLQYEFKYIDILKYIDMPQLEKRFQNARVWNGAMVACSVKSMAARFIISLAYFRVS